MTLDLPVPDIPVNSTRFTAAILRPRTPCPLARTSGSGCVKAASFLIAVAGREPDQLLRSVPTVT